MDTNIVGQRIGKLGNAWREQVARACIRRRLSPLLLTTAGLGLNIVGGLLIGAGFAVQASPNWLHFVAGIILLLAGALDLLDDMVARLSENVTKFAAFSDSVFDLYSDLAIFAGALTYFAARGSLGFVIVSAIAFGGVLMTRYTQARAESLLPGRYNAGYMQRPEWIMVVIVSCLLNRLSMGMALIALLSNLAAFHRIWDTHQTAHNLEHPDEAGRGYGSVSAPAFTRFWRSVIFWTFPRQSWQHDLLSGILLLALVLSMLVMPV